MTHGIVLTNNGIYHHRKQHKVGGRINQSNDTIRRMSSQINNPSTGIAGLGTQSSLLSRSAFTPSGTSIVIGGGGNLTSQMAKLNFNTNKSKDRNVRLRL
jgi:hypothetical protein